MSYILDAIKKAEKQRQIERVPTLETALTAESRSSDRSFTGWFLMWLLISILVALAIVYREPLAVEVHSLSASARQAVTDLGSALYSAGDGENAKTSEQRVEPASLQPAAEDQAPADAVVSAPAAEQPDVTESVKLATEASSTGDQAQVELNVEISAISYSANADKRFIMSGADILREGDRVSGYEIQEIRKHSVILGVDGVAREVRP